jgi:translocation and assembly module TamA
LVLRLLTVLLLTAAFSADAADRPLARFDVPAEAAALEPLLKRTIDAAKLADSIDPEDDERQLRRLRATALDLLATEGYFVARIEVVADGDAARYVLKVQPGPRTMVTRAEIVLKGAIEKDPARMQELLRGWELPVGKPFRDPQWSTAKTRLLSKVQEMDFAAAHIVNSLAEVDTDDATVALHVEIDSGPAFTLGELQIKGLRRYEPLLVERYNPFTPGDRYDAVKLLDMQRRLQASPYFASVLVDIDTDPARPERVPIRIELTEAKTKRVAFGLGYSTNTGPRAEATYRQAQVFGFPYPLQAGVGVDRTRDVIYSDLYLPPKPNGAIDSIGALIERTDIENVITRRWAVGVARTLTRETSDASYDTKIAFNYQDENRRLRDNSAPETTNNVVSGTFTWTRRTVDKITDPTRGDIMTASTSAGLRSGAVGDVLQNTFLRLYGRYVKYLPLSPRDQVILRGEIGHVVADTIDFVPNEFLFRAGGAGSVRGYAYQSLGLKTGSATLGSRSLAVGSAEYVRWITQEWGGAVFYDVGDADDELLKIRWARGYGVGARWRTIAGPLALDVAYGERDRRMRVHFSIAVAF